jgi:hypothetical protein
MWPNAHQTGRLTDETSRSESGTVPFRQRSTFRLLQLGRRIEPLVDFKELLAPRQDSIHKGQTKKKPGERAL